jgi:hypothetical protein
VTKAEAQPIAIVLHSANLRAGPGTDYILVGAAQPGDRLPIRGRTEAGDWWLVSAGAGTAWIFGELVEVQNAVSIPIAPAPPKTAANTISHSSPQFGFAYGIQAHLGSDIDRVIAATRDLGFSWIKGQLRWKDVEGSPGQVRWSEVDPLIDAVAGADLRLLLTIMAAPEWARPGGDYRVEGPPQEPALYAAKGHPSFFFLETLERYHSLMVTHGDARKRIWATEFGWPVDPTPPSGYEYAADNSEWEQSEFTRVAFQLGRLTDEQAQVICVMRQESERLRLMIDRLIARREVEALEMTEDGGRTTKAVCSSVMAPISDPIVCV